MLSKKELEMYYAVGRNVRVTCKDRSVVEGHCTEFIQPLDNDPEVAEIEVKRGTMSVVGITEPEIEKIDYID